MLTDAEWTERVKEWRPEIEAIARGEPDRTTLNIPLSMLMNQVTLADILHVTEIVTNVPPEIVMGYRRHLPFREARQIAYLLARDAWKGLKWPELAAVFKRDRGSLRNLLNDGKTRLKYDLNFAGKLDRARELL